MITMLKILPKTAMILLAFLAIFLLNGIPPFTLMITAITF